MTTNANKIAETIIAKEHAINDRWNCGDVDGALEEYSNEVTYFDPLTERRLEGRKEVEAYFRQFFEGKLNIVRNEFGPPQVIVADGGDLAVVNYNLNNFVAGPNGEEQPGSRWNSTQVYRLIDDDWKIVHVNWSFTQHPAAMQGLALG